MKKVLFTVALLFGVFAASAQVSVVKEAKSKKGNPEEAVKIIEAALTNPETANDPETWKLAGDFQKAIYDAENEKLYLSAVDKSLKVDTNKLYNSLLKMFDCYLKCDEVEQAKVASGELKKPKLRKKNAATLSQLRINLVNGGVEAFNVGNHANALKYFGMYVDVINNPIFADQAAALQADTLTSLYANYAAMAASAVQNPDAVIKYGNIGKENDEEGWRSLMYMAEVYGKEKVDSVKWLETIKEGTERFPSQDYFVGNVMDYYLSKGLVTEALTQIDKLLAVNETPYYLYVKGVLLVENKNYDAAQAVLDKVIALNGNLVAEAYIKKGECYVIPAQDIVEENSSLNLDDPKYNTNEAKIKEYYELAKPYYEKARELRPNESQLWGNALLAIYWKLSKAEYEALAKEMGLE
ncbi:MAG: hypothetical protein J6B31_08175 [Bacteroidaceae bacterium]|nr:hypothetical protein [Bacteroidaceae bacterium]